MPLPLFIAKRLHGHRTATRIATIGVAVGVAVMILSVSVVLGFKQTIRDKAVGFGGHLQVANFYTLQSSDHYPIIADSALLERLDSIDGVTHAQRYAIAQGILKTDDDFLGVQFKGVAEEWDSSFIASHLVDGTIPTFSARESSNNILISRTIAKKLQVSTGDRLFAYFFAGDNVRTRRFTIAGVYETHLSHYDNIMCFTDLRTTVKLNGWDDNQALGVELTIADFEQLDAVYDQLISRINRTRDANGATYSSRTVRETNPQLFAWLDLLDMNIWIILALMVVVASVTIVSGLLIIILEHTGTIGTLKALGARTRTLRNTFLYMGAFIALRGLLWGNAVAVVLIVLQKLFGIIKLDSATYYVSTVPVYIDLPLWLAINIAVLVISTLVLVVPTFLVASIKPIKAIKFD